MAEISEEDRKELLDGYIPKERFDEATNKLQKKNEALSNDLANLQGQFSVFQQTQNAQSPSETPVTYTRAQLRAYVDDEKLTQEEADEYWDAQTELAQDRKFAAFRQEVNSNTNDKLSTQSVSAKVDEYIKILPDLSDEGSDNRTKVKGEYDSLVKTLGRPKPGTDQELKLQLSALERSFGPTEKLKEKLKSSDEDHETMESLGGGEGSENESDKVPAKGALKNLSAEQKTYYQKGIENGRYKDWDDVKSELEYTRKKT